MAGCTLTVDLPTAREVSDDGGEGGASAEESQGGASAEEGQGGDLGGQGGQDEPGGFGPGSCGGVDFSPECSACGDACCAEWSACDGSVPCLCWSGCMVDDSVPASACDAVCGKPDLAVETLQACLADECPACAWW